MAGIIVYSRFIRSEIAGVSNSPRPATVSADGRSMSCAHPEPGPGVHLGGLRLPNHGPCLSFVVHDQAQRYEWAGPVV